jgi:uncharacterized membrane protein (DUF4010 family)
MNLGPTELVVLMLLAVVLFFAWVGVVQLSREKRWGVIAVLAVLCVLGLGVLAFSLAGAFKFPAWRRTLKARRGVRA